MTDREALTRLRCDVARLRREVRALQRRLDVTAVIAPLVNDVARSRDDRDVLLDDILLCWEALPPAARTTYLDLRHHTPLEAFAGDYVEAVDWHAARHAEPNDGGPAAEDQRLRLGWLHHLATIRYRLASGSPPASSWLAMFPFNGE